MLRPGLILLLFAHAAAAQEDLAAALAGAVDQPTARMRRQAAAKLAREKGAPLAAWLEAARSFGTFRAAPAGVRTETVPLRVGKQVESTELNCFVPKSYEPTRPSPLLVAFHGTGGGGRYMIPPWQTVAEKLRMLILAPTEAGKNKGYEFSERERASSLAAIRWMRRRFNVDENRIFVTGSSRGGHLAWDLALRHRDRFAAAAPMLGCPRINTAKEQNNLRLDDEAYKRFLQREADARTARLTVERKTPGRFVATGEKVKSFRLLLSEAMLAPGEPVHIEFNGKKKRRPARPRVQTMLQEFVERFDRTFLPVVDVKVP